MLDAAVVAFAESGYDGVGLREIAVAAGVNSRLISHYFGSKEGLFRAVLDRVSDGPFLLTPEGAQGFMTVDPPLDDLAGLLTMLRSTSSRQAMAIIRGEVANRYEADLAASLTGPDARGRAALINAITVGIRLMREVVGNEALKGEDAAAIVPYLDAIARILYDAPADKH
ncbi:TetR/AcrR family transcriptional regulator [Streptomyces sp. AS58]|uniref:TetR/AcrR family transcriptional regulator n=1 Tax=Streptomyces sp. AS58 TaxID=1519489 RepID=UPI0022773895|nr:TetR/AcrR family transcriptional regulator [Streptomyces sp. AS58]